MDKQRGINCLTDAVSLTERQEHNPDESRYL